MSHPPSSTSAPSILFPDGLPSCRFAAPQGNRPFLTVGQIHPPRTGWPMVVGAITAQGLMGGEHTFHVPGLVVFPLVLPELDRRKIRATWSRYSEGKLPRADLPDLDIWPGEETVRSAAMEIRYDYVARATQEVLSGTVSRLNSADENIVPILRNNLSLRPWVFLYQRAAEFLRKQVGVPVGESDEDVALHGLNDWRPGRGDRSYLPKYGIEEALVLTEPALDHVRLGTARNGGRNPAAYEGKKEIAKYVSKIVDPDEYNNEDDRSAALGRRARAIEKRAQRRVRDFVKAGVAPLVLLFGGEMGNSAASSPEAFAAEWLQRPLTAKKLLVLAWGDPKRFTSWAHPPLQ